MSVFVFLGPSLPRVEAQVCLDAVYLPPVSMGDLYTLVVTRARSGDHVAIIDGLFEQVPAVWHKEILYALSRGIHVYGAASMGALRAAELHTFGMRGVGRIFEAYRDLLIENDDEVVVSHADAANGYRSLSTALVSIRFGIEEMIQSEAITSALGRSLVASAAALPYSRRTWAEVLRAAIDLDAPANCVARIREQAARPDAKAQDAAALLRFLCDKAQHDNEPHEPNFIFQNTSFWNDLTQSMALRVETERHASQFDDGFERNAIANFVRAGGHRRDQWLEAALLDRLAVDFAKSFVPGRKELREAELRIARRNGIVNVSSMRSWLNEQCIADSEWQQVLEVDARRYWLRRAMVGQLDIFLIARLKAEGLYQSLRASRRIARDEILRGSIAKPSLADFGLTPEILQNWYVERFGPMSPDPTSHAQSLNFASLREFIDALLECYLADKSDSDPTHAVFSGVATGKEDGSGDVAAG
jgi:hypothetical protein